MQVNATQSASQQTVGNAEPLSKVKQLFLQLGSALASGDVSAAKQAFTELQKYAPSRTEVHNNPMRETLAIVGKALDSGDLKAAQSALSAIKTVAAHATAGGGKARGAGGPPPGGGSGKAANVSRSSSSSSKVYDPKDANQDGTVSWKEAQDYELKHPETPAVENEASALDTLA